MTKYGRPSCGHAGVEDLGDVRMVHHGERLALGLEARERPRESMPGLMSLSATLRRIGLLLLGAPDDAHAAFADPLEQPVAAEPSVRRIGGLDDVLPGVHGQCHQASGTQFAERLKLSASRAPHRGHVEG